MGSFDYRPYVGIVAAFGYSGLAYPDLPDQVPVLGIATDVSVALPWGAFTLPFICLVVLVFFQLVVSRQHDAVRAHLGQVWFALSIGLAIVCVADIASARGAAVAAENVAWLVVGGVLVVVSNSMAKLPVNSIAGIRLPWTRRSQRVWYATNKFAGMVGTGVGVMMICVALLVTAPSIALLIIAAFGLAAVVIGQSWRIHRRTGY